jgi:hypothetical protein
LNVTNDEICIWEYDNVGDDEKIGRQHLIAVESDIFAFFEKLHGGGEGLAVEPDAIVELTASGDIRRLEEFVHSGADINSVRTRDGETFMQAAIYDEDLPFLDAALKMGASIRGVLHVASKSNMLDAIEWLLKNGADVNELDEKGLTPLDWAPPGTGARVKLIDSGGCLASELKS